MKSQAQEHWPLGEPPHRGSKCLARRVLAGSRRVEHSMNNEETMRKTNISGPRWESLCDLGRGSGSFHALLIPKPFHLCLTAYSFLARLSVPSSSITSPQSTGPEARSSCHPDSSTERIYLEKYQLPGWHVKQEK